MSAAHADRQAAGLYEAMALRFYGKYLDWRLTAHHYGALGVEPAPDDRATARSRYDDLVREWVFEPPSGAQAALALLDFASLIAVDQIMGETMRDATPNNEIDITHQAIAICAAGRWLNHNVVLPEFVKASRAKSAQP